ncbi:MAG: sulfite exporter TauE/SafE family protein [Elusimicrobia bacterium]|nr:sulfite exporter TauE/SafE family protein [Elusimicrobiota bacterium]
MIDGFILGLSNTFGCITVCAPIFLPYLLASELNPLIQILKFLAGRLIAYLFFALFAGYISIYFEGKINPDILYSLTVILAIWLILFSIGKMRIHAPVCKIIGKNVSGKNMPFFLGIVLGLNLCPPFLIGLNEVLKFGSLIKSVIFFAGFYLGSSLWTFLLLFSKPLQNNKYFQIAAQIIGVIVGLYYLWKGVSGFF